MQLDRKMKILMFNYEYPPLGGGGGVFNKQLAEKLVEKGHKITVITSNYNSQKTRETVEGVNVIRVPVLLRSDQNAAGLLSMLSYFPTSLVAGHKQLSKGHYDLIHTMFAIPSAPSALALSKYFKIPHILSLLGGDIYDPSKKLSPHKTPLLHATVKRMMEGSDKVVALSNDIKSRAVEYYNIAKKLELIHLGIPAPENVSVNRAEFGFSEDDILLVTVGRLVARKGLNNLIEIIKSLGNKNLKLVVIGDGPEKNGLQEQANDLGLQSHIRFMGYVNDTMKFKLLSVSDIYASTSNHEGFGIVFLEAMAAGLPVICYNKGGQSDFLKDEQTGYLVEHGDKELFRDRLKELCEEKMLREKISNFNHVYIQDFYIDTCAGKYEGIYDSLCNIHTP
jgi:glycosyltransferase involved in cell wall biosynthesis